MSISTERMDKLTEFLNTDEKRAQKLLSLEASLAVKEINGHGHDFTELELQAYGEALQATTKQLVDDALEGVAGGVSSMNDFMSKDNVTVNNGALMTIVYGVMPRPGIIRPGGVNAWLTH